MMKLVCLAVFLAVASADVSHLFNKYPYQQKYQPYKPVQYYNPTPAPFVPLPVAPSYTRTGEAAAAVLRLDSDIRPDGSYEYGYDTENGISARASGVLRQVGKDAAVVVQGSYQYPSPAGPVSVSYIADENGFQPSSDILPKAHPIPEAILRSIQFNEAQERATPVKPYYREY